VLNRQCIILYMLKKAGGKAARIELMKWAFLLTQETESRGGPAFYDFVPYKYGPYSFLMHQDMLSLEKSGLVEQLDAKIWGLRSENEFSFELPRVIQDVSRILLRYRGMGINDLIDSVYSRYPWFTINCENVDRRAYRRPSAHDAVYTIGYQGVSIDAFLNELLRSGITTLADVRNNPASRSFGFHKSTLSRLCGNVGIEYSGFPELGIPASNRADLKSVSHYESLFKRYRSDILKNKSGYLELLAKKVTDKSTALVCMESDASWCHRSHLALMVADIVKTNVIHLRSM
jgi:uncharacterized protein (DUF488 family)